MQFKSIVLSLTILSAVFVNAVPIGTGSSGSDAGGIGGLIGGLLAVAGPAQKDSKSVGTQGSYGINPNVAADNTNALNDNAVQLDPQVFLPLLSEAKADFSSSGQEFSGQTRNGDYPKFG